MLALCAGPARGDGSQLLAAARDADSPRARSLLAAGAPANHRGPLDETALHWAAFHGLVPLARELLARGAPVAARVRDGNTALHQAAYRGHLGMVRLLLAAGAPPHAMNAAEARAVDWAHRNGHDAVVRELVAAGAALHRRSSRGDARVRDEGISRPREASSRAGTRATAARDRRRAVTRGEARQSRAPGLSMRLGDLPPLVLRLPARDASPGVRLTLTRALITGVTQATPRAGNLAAASRREAVAAGRLAR